MRQKAVMTKTLLFTFLSLFLIINVASGQDLDEDGQILLDVAGNQVIVECNNFDMVTFEADLETLIDNHANTVGFNDSTNGPCPPDPSYDTGSSAIVANYDYTCTDVVDVEIDVTGCDGALDTWTVQIVVEDTQFPFDFTTDSSLDDPNVTAHACDLVNTDQAITDWIADIEDNGQSNGFTYFADNCNVDPTAFTITAQSTPVPLDYNTCVEMIYSVTFDVDDGCSGVTSFTYDFEIVDDTDPTWMTIPDVTVDCENLQGTDHQADFDQWVADIINNVDGYAEDECDIDVVNGPVIISDGPYTVMTDQCANPPNVWEQVVTFTVEDNCQNTAEISATYTIVDNFDPVWNIGAGALDFLETPCDVNNGVDHENEFANWVANIEATAAVNGDVTDDCSDMPANLMVVADIQSIVIDYQACDADPFIHEELVTFTATDLCGNTATFEATWQLEDDTDPVIDMAALTSAQPVPVPECDDLASIQADVEAMLLAPGVLTDGCTDLSNLVIGDFTIVPDPATIGPDDLDLGGSECYIIPFSVFYTDPCGIVSNTVDFDFEVKDETAPDASQMPPFDDGNLVILGNQCPDAIMTEQDVLDIIVAGAFPFGSIIEACTDENDIIATVVGFSPGDFCGDTGFIEWDFEDECENVDPNGPYRVEWLLDVGNPDPNAYTPLDWLVDPEDFFPPEDITISFDDADCTNEFAMCMWNSDPFDDGSPNVWPWEAAENAVWEGGCDVKVTYSHLPCQAAVDAFPNQVPPPELVDFATNSLTTTEVCVTIEDECDPAGNLEYCWNVTVRCSTCGLGQDVFCATCDEAGSGTPDQGGCKLCDPDLLADGYSSCTPPCGGPGEPPCNPPAGEQPSPLCMATGVPNNMSWFAFVASAETLDLEVDVGACSQGAGVQAGIYEDCSWTNCIIFFPGGGSNCFSNSSSESASNFIPGNTYYLWVDGCGGDECEYTVTVVGLEFLGLPEMSAVTAYSVCRDMDLSSNDNDPNYGGPQISPDGSTNNCDINDAITVCPGETLQLSVVHQGNPSNPVPIHQEECNEYSVNLSADFIWNVEWMGQVIHNPVINGDDLFLEEIQAPMDPGVYEVCLDAIDFECDPKFGPACLTIHVENRQNETYIQDVCVEELEAMWDPADHNQDPNMDGLGWLGVPVTLTEVDNWPLITTGQTAGYRCMDFIHEDPECLCPVPQTLCIKVRGDRDKTPVELYMYRCQFLECDSPLEYAENQCSSEPYEWAWDWNPTTETFDLYNEDDPAHTNMMCFRIPTYHTQMDSWRPEFCDTIPEVTVISKDPVIDWVDNGCGSYTAGLDFEEMEESEWDFYPPIFDANSIVEFVDCNTGATLGGAMDPNGQTGSIQLNAPNSNVCIKITYSFEDGAWWNYDLGTTYDVDGLNQPQIQTCTSYWGPYDWGQGQPPAPSYTGDDTFCATDLDNHVFEITNPVLGFTYVWNDDPVMPGVTVTDISTAGDGTMVEISLPTGWGANDCTNVYALASCGPSPSTPVCFTLQAPPTVDVDPIADICVNDAPDGNATTVANVSATASPAGANYCYTWGNNGANTVTTANMTTYNFSSAGTQTVTVAVEDKDSGCRSVVSAPVTFEVIDNLPPPAATCGIQGQTELEITWDLVPGATGYTVFVDGVAVTPNFGATDQSHTETGLSLGQTITFTVMALGDAPCLNSALSQPVPCETSNCPPASVMQDIQGMTFCENESLGTIDIAAGFPFTEPTGALSYVSTPPGIVVGGMLDTDVLTEGVYDIVVTYTFDQLCPDRVFNLQYVVTGVPDPSFSIESPICVNNAAAVLTAPEGNVTWDYDSDNAFLDANGNIKWDEAGTYTVQALSDIGGCLDSATFEVVVEPALEDITLVGPCNSGLDFVDFDWNDVPGATGYEVVFTNLTSGMTENISLTAAESMLYRDGLTQDDQIEILVTATSNLPGCESSATFTCQATACAQYPPLSFNCLEEVGSVTISWDAIPGITEYIVTNLDDNIPMTQTGLEFMETGLDPMTLVTISVEPVHPTAGCNIAPLEFSCESICPGIPVMSEVQCGETSITFVEFDWAAVSGIDGYEVTWSINGGAETIDTIQNEGLDFPGELWPTDLNADDEVAISVVAINPDQLCGNNPPESQECTASACIQPTFTDPMLEECWDPTTGPIQVMIGSVVDPNGDPMIGDVEWLDPEVDPISGMFTPPDDAESDEYTLRFRWEDRDFPTLCQFPGEITIQVNVKPTPDINPMVANICVGDVAIITGVESPDRLVDVSWDYDGGMLASGSWPDIEVSYDSPGIKTVTITETVRDSDPLCTTDATVSFEVLAIEMLDVSCKAVTNNTVTFEWTAFPGALGYSFTIDNGTDQQTTDTEYTVTGLTNDDPVVINVVAIFDPMRPCDVVGTATCTPGDCPPATWLTDVNNGQELGGFCPEELESLSLSVPGAEALTGGPNELTPAYTIGTETWRGHPSIDENTGEFIYDPAANLEGEVINITYEVIFVAPDGSGDECTYSQTYSFEVYPSPNLAITPGDVMCEWDEVPFVTLEGGGGTGPYTYQWNNSPPETIDPVFNIPAAGTYEMIVTDANGCSAVESVDILGTSKPEVTIAGPSTIFVGATEMFEYVLGDLSIPVNSVVWYIDDVPIDLQPDQEILEILGDLDSLGRDFTLKVEVYFSEECFIEADQRVDIIDVEKWYIPNVISTGAEGEDSDWNMFTKGDVIVQKLSIYDRWGELVFIKNLDPMIDATEIQGAENTGLKWNLGWTGRWGPNGANVEQGVYVYVIDMVVDSRPEIEAGDVTIFR